MMMMIVERSCAGQAVPRIIATVMTAVRLCLLSSTVSLSHFLVSCHRLHWESWREDGGTTEWGKLVTFPSWMEREESQPAMASCFPRSRRDKSLGPRRSSLAYRSVNLSCGIIFAVSV